MRPGGGSPGNRYGCAAALLVGVPVYFYAIWRNILYWGASPTLRDHVPVVLVALGTGLTVRWIVNRGHGRGD